MESSSILIRKVSPAAPEDALTLIEEYYEAVGVVARDSREAILEYIAAPDSAVWVAYADSEPAGCIVLRPLPQRESAGEVKRLYVRARDRGLGLASLLLRTLEQYAFAQNLSWLYLDTKDDLREALAFYTKHGYERCARYNNNPQATIFMRKSLNGKPG